MSSIVREGLAKGLASVMVVSCGLVFGRGVCFPTQFPTPLQTTLSNGIMRCLNDFFRERPELCGFHPSRPRQTIKPHCRQTPHRRRRCPKVGVLFQNLNPLISKAFSLLTTKNRGAFPTQFPPFRCRRKYETGPDAARHRTRS